MLKISELANHERIPIKFLEAIFVEAKGAGYIDSKRGKNGVVSMGSVVRLVEGPLVPIRCAS